MTATPMSDADLDAGSVRRRVRERWQASFGGTGDVAIRAGRLGREAVPCTFW
jgi:hypothetical protein